MTPQTTSDFMNEPKDAQSVASSELLAAVVRKERDLICEAIGNELASLKKQKDEIESKMHRLWDTRAELLRDRDRR